MATDTLRLIDECPTVVGMMTTVVESGGSLDTAIRSVAEDGPPRSARTSTASVVLVSRALVIRLMSCWKKSAASCSAAVNCFPPF